MCDNVPLVCNDADGFAVVVCESHLDHVITFVVCYVLSILYISAAVKYNLELFFKNIEINNVCSKRCD